METTRRLVLIATIILTLGGPPLAFGETQFESFAVQAEVNHPPDPVLPAELSVGAMFVPAEGVAPPERAGDPHVLAARSLLSAPAVRAHLGADPAGGLFRGGIQHAVSPQRGVL